MTWPLRCLCELASINPKFDAKDINKETKVSFVPMASVSETLGTVIREEERPLNEVLKGYTPFLNGDILIAKITPCFENGKIAVAQLSRAAGFGSTEFHVVRPLPHMLDTRYVFHFLRQPIVRQEGESRMTGSAGQRRVPKNFIEALRIPFPPLAEQKRIAALLDEADALLHKRSEALAKLDILLQSVFLEMFGDPITNPKRWKVSRFETVTKSKLGKMLDEKKQAHLPQRKYLRNANVRWGGFNLTDISEMGIADDERERYEVLPGDLLVCEGGEPGRAAIWSGEIAECYYQKALHRLRVNRSICTSEYILYLLWRLSLSGGLSDSISLVTIAHLTGEKLKELQVPVPPLKLQEEFSRRIAEINVIRAQSEASLSRIKLLVATLQHQVFQNTTKPENPSPPCLTLDF